MSKSRNIPDPVSVYERLQEAYGRLGKPAEADTMMQRACLPPVASDYAVETEVAETVREFKQLVRGKRFAYQEEEITRLHREWVEHGGRFLGFPDATLDVHLQAMLQGDRLVAGGTAVVSERFGTIDPGSLNGGLGNFRGGVGELRLMGALAVATGKYDWNLDQLPTTLKSVGGDPRVVMWKNMHVDWR